MQWFTMEGKSSKASCLIAKGLNWLNCTFNKTSTNDFVGIRLAVCVDLLIPCMFTIHIFKDRLCDWIGTMSFSWFVTYDAVKNIGQIFQIFQSFCDLDQFRFLCRFRFKHNPQKDTIIQRHSSRMFCHYSPNYVMKLSLPIMTNLHLEWSLYYAYHESYWYTHDHAPCKLRERSRKAVCSNGFNEFRWWIKKCWSLVNYK